MSYCRFQNTKNDLIDCRDNINDYSMSKEELIARNILIQICQDIVDQAETILNTDLEN